MGEKFFQRKSSFNGGGSTDFLFQQRDISAVYSIKFQNPKEHRLGIDYLVLFEKYSAQSIVRLGALEDELKQTTYSPTVVLHTTPNINEFMSQHPGATTTKLEPPNTQPAIQIR